MTNKNDLSYEANETEGQSKVSVPHYDKADRDHMRRLLKKAASLIDLIAKNIVPLGSYDSADLVDALAARIGYENEKQKDELELQELKDDRQVLINLYGAAKRGPDLPQLYAQLGNLLRKYGLFDEEVVLLENAIADGIFNDDHLITVKERLRKAGQYREADDACMSEQERIAETLRRELQKKPLNEAEIDTALKQCTDDAVLYDIACNNEPDPKMIGIRGAAARRICSRDYMYALSSHLQYSARTSMILNLYDPLEGDDLFIARTILTDPVGANKTHMLLFCKDEALLMLGRLYVYGAVRTCTDCLHYIGSRFPEAYKEMEPQDKLRCKQEWLAHAADLAMDILSEDEAVRSRVSGTADVDSETLYFFASIHHRDPAVRIECARKLKNQMRIAYVGSWTSDDKIKKELSVRINNTRIITEVLYGDYSGADLIFGFKKPDDLTIQDRFCVEIMKNNPDPAIREHVRTELIKGKVEIPGADLTRPDPFWNPER
ncbi:MAG: hypothetical protein IJL97_01870 [Lachnospiraceae bacterium]|nr:hypothetical protein [Lachnospiraceae bacterium]